MVRVSIKHAGKVYDAFELDTSQPGAAFMQAVYERIGVPVDRMKIMIKGGLLKKDSDWNKIGGAREASVAFVMPNTRLTTVNRARSSSS